MVSEQPISTAMLTDCSACDYDIHSADLYSVTGATSARYRYIETMIAPSDERMTLWKRTCGLAPVQYALAACLALLSCFPSRIATAADTLQIVTEYSPPFTEMGTRQESGYATVPVRAIVHEAGYDPVFTVLSWKGALEIVQSRPEALIYPIARIPERENRYTWIGRIGQMKYFVYKRRDATIARPSDLDGLKQYRIAAVRKDLRESFLLAHGFQMGTDHGLIGVSDNVEAFQLLRVGRVDLGIFSPLSITQLCLNEKVDCHQFEVVMPLGLSSDLYLAGNKLMPAAEQRRLSAAYRLLSGNGTLKQITPASFFPQD
ncbi:MAG: transporter substrate-binding domain-containing protein [Burkholderiales bacterium]|nr:transporter substrate-binding domain-containing protein [Burkholderiales bacterium]